MNDLHNPTVAQLMKARELGLKVSLELNDNDATSRFSAVYDEEDREYVIEFGCMGGTLRLGVMRDLGACHNNLIIHGWKE